ncbi:MAG: efflux RND transporter periplasmic adaptor subunit [Verrucomicrobiota bacterium]
MKTTLILTVITILSLGTLALLRAQDNEPQIDLEVGPPEAETTEVTVAPAGIRTNVATQLTLLGGTKEVTAIPVASVFAQDDRFFVLARSAKGGFGFAETEVTLGNTDGILVEVTEGIFPGDEVVTVSVHQLRFPAFEDSNGAFCGVGGCGESACDSATGTCSIEKTSAAKCDTTGVCKEGETCSTTSSDCTTCKSAASCSDCESCSTGVDLTITADEFFHSPVQVIHEPMHFIGAPPMFPPY